MNKFSGVYFITDSSSVDEEVFLNKVESALKGGASILQLREKAKTTREYICLAKKVHEITKKYNVPLIIDDRVDVMLAAQAEGVHLGNDDMTVSDARKILGNKKIIGATAKTVESAAFAFEAGADYLGVGAIFPTTTKVKTVLTSTETLRDICEKVPISVFAIGGLNAENIDILKEIKISGVCAVSAIMNSECPGNEVKKIKRKLEMIL